jgi:hypothetical protein
MPEPAGSGSLSVTEVAVPVPGLEEFETVIVNPTVVPAGTGVASAVLVIDRDGMFTVTDAEADSGGAARPSSVSVPVAVALSVTVAVTTLEQVKVQVAPGSRTVLTLLELDTKVAEPQNEPVTLTPLKGSEPVLVSL